MLLHVTSSARYDRSQVSFNKSSIRYHLDAALSVNHASISAHASFVLFKSDESGDCVAKCVVVSASLSSPFLGVVALARASVRNFLISSGSALVASPIYSSPHHCVACLSALSDGHPRASRLCAHFAAMTSLSSSVCRSSQNVNVATILTSFYRR